MTNWNWLQNFYAVCKNAVWHLIKTKDFKKRLITIEIMNKFNIMRSTDRNINLHIKFDFIILDQFHYKLGKFGLLERECRSMLLISYRHILTNNRWIFFPFYNPIQSKALFTYCFNCSLFMVKTSITCHFSNKSK